MAAKANGKSRPQGDDAGAAKKRSQLIVIAVGGAMLVALVGYQLPGLLGSSSPSGTADAATTPPPAVPVTKPAGRTGSSSPVPAWIRAIAARDVFVPQVVVSTPGAKATTAAVTPTPPPVRATGWVVKDPFVPQVALPARRGADRNHGRADHPPRCTRPERAERRLHRRPAGDLGRRRQQREGGRP